MTDRLKEIEERVDDDWPWKDCGSGTVLDDALYLLTELCAERTRREAAEAHNAELQLALERFLKVASQLGGNSYDGMDEEHVTELHEACGNANVALAAYRKEYPDG